MRYVKALVILSVTLAVAFSLLPLAVWAADVPRLIRDPGSLPPDTFVIDENSLSATWPQGHLMRMGNQSPQWKPMPSDPKSYFCTQQFSAWGGSGGLWIYVNAGQAMNERLKYPGSLKDSTESIIRANQSQNENSKYVKECSDKGYPYLYHYLSTYDSNGRTSYQEGFNGYAKGYFIRFFFNGSNRTQYMPPPQWVEGVFYQWLERLPTLDAPGSPGVTGSSSKSTGSSGSQEAGTAAATAAAGAAMSGGLLLRKLLGIRPLPAQAGGNAGGSEAGETGESENREKGRRLWVTTTAHRRRIRADGKDVVWVYARAETDDPEYDTHSLTRGMDFPGAGSAGTGSP